MQPEHTENPVASAALTNIGTAIERALDVAPLADVLSIVTGAFVGLMLEVVRSQGHDLSLPITVDGGTGRDITIHPPKPSAEGRAAPAGVAAG